MCRNHFSFNLDTRDDLLVVQDLRAMVPLSAYFPGG